MHLYSIHLNTSCFDGNAIGDGSPGFWLTEIPVPLLVQLSVPETCRVRIISLSKVMGSYSKKNRDVFTKFNGARTLFKTASAQKASHNDVNSFELLETKIRIRISPTLYY